MENKEYYLKELVKVKVSDADSFIDKEGAIYLGQLIDMFPEDTKIQFNTDGTLSKDCKAYTIVDKSIDFIDDDMIKLWDENNLNLRKIVNDKSKYLDMFARLLEECAANM